MCVTFFCLHPQISQQNSIQFVLAFNRDEQTRRDTDPLAPFNQDPNIYAGRDKISGGTWLGVNVKTGIMVILTNYDLQMPRLGFSRGKLVFSFLKTQTFQNLPIQKYDQFINLKLRQVIDQRKKYSAFNLLIYSIQTQKIFYICSQMEQELPKVLQNKKFYGMCNGPLDQLWQKTNHGLNIFEQIIKKLNFQKSPEQYFFKETYELLKDSVRFDADVQKEASIFISPYYNENEKAERMTKCSFSCIVKKSKEGKGYEIRMKEVTYNSPKLEQTIVQLRKKIGNQQDKE